MRHSPLDIHHKSFRYSIKGYNVEEVTTFLSEIAEDISEILRDKNSSKVQLNEKDKMIQDLRDREKTLKETVSVSQKLAETVREEMSAKLKNVNDQASIDAKELFEKSKSQADEIIRIAKRQSEDMIRAAQNKADELLNEAHHVSQKVADDAAKKADTVIDESLHKKYFLEKVILDLTRQKEELKRSLKSTLDMHYELLSMIIEKESKGATKISTNNTKVVGTLSANA